MSRVDEDVEGMSFDAQPTGRFGLSAVSARGNEAPTAPVRARGTPRASIPASDPATDPALAPPADPACDDGLPTFDETTAAREPSGAPLLEESAPLDRDATERGLLAAIASGDEAARPVYADWLEERSEHARAGFLRIEQLVVRMPPSDPRLEACTRQLRELAQHVDPDWRARIARARIENCPAPASRCPGRWDALARTPREAVRRCGLCAQHVRYFESVDDARAAARSGGLVAIELGSERWEGDLADAGARCRGCSRRIPSRARYCPHCGQQAVRDEDSWGSMDIDIRPFLPFIDPRDVVDDD